MKESFRFRLWGVGFAAVGLAVGTGLGAVAGTALSPDGPASAPTTSTVTTTTTTPPPPEIPTAAPLGMDAPVFATLGVGSGTIIATPAPSNSGGWDLHRVITGSLVERVDPGFGGSIAGFGTAGVAVDTSDGVLVAPFDGGPARLVATGGMPTTWRDSSLLWLEPAGDSRWNAMSLDLDVVDAEPVAHQTFDLALDRSAGLLAVDDRGSVVGVEDSTWVVPTGNGLPWRIGALPWVLLDEAIVVETDVGDGVTELAHLDRATGARVVPDPAFAEIPSDCELLAGAGTTLAVRCGPRELLVVGAGSTLRLIADEWVEVLDDGETVIGYSTGDGDGPFTARIDHLDTGATGTIGSDRPIRAVRP